MTNPRDTKFFDNAVGCILLTATLSMLILFGAIGLVVFAKMIGG